MREIFLAFGSNIGNKTEYIKKAYELLETSQKIKILQKSAFYFSKAYKGDNLNDFVNTVIKAETLYSPHELLVYVKNIEKTLGRIKTTADFYENRPIDIDILFYGEENINEKELIIPHKDIENRDFVLVPLKEIAPEKILPDGKTPAEAIKLIKNTTKVISYD